MDTLLRPFSEMRFFTMFGLSHSPSLVMGFFCDFASTVKFAKRQYLTQIVILCDLLRLLFMHLISRQLAPHCFPLKVIILNKFCYVF